MSNEPSESGLDPEIELTYEEAYEQLEQILEAIESGDLALEEALSLYERGAMLAAYCTRLLDEAELRVEQWQPDGGTVPGDGWQTP